MTMTEMVILAIQWVIPLLLAVTLHEAGHAYAAKRLGDPTADNQGRVTLNPIKHIDPIGTIALPALLFFLKAPFLFGYAKPVPVSYQLLRTLPRDIAIVAIAGPAANFILIILSALAFNLGFMLPDSWQQPFAQMIAISIGLNTILAVFNLLPIPPLDGSKILMVYAPRPVGRAIMALEPYGLFLVLGILMLMPYLTSQLGYNPLASFFGGAIEWVLTMVEPLMRLHCISVRSEACGNLLP
ncbi:MAG: peptidase M50 [Rhodomicrobium sp.]|nr:MAG: peptidase M50 [Rhodomicrobium sp.]